MISFSSWELWSIAGAVLSVMGVLVLLMVAYDQRSRGHYNSEKHRMELELMRRSIESQIYSLTDKLVATEGRWKDVNHLLLSSQNLQKQSVSKARVSLTSFLETAGLSESDMDVDDELVF